MYLRYPHIRQGAIALRNLVYIVSMVYLLGAGVYIYINWVCDQTRFVESAIVIYVEVMSHGYIYAVAPHPKEYSAPSTCQINTYQFEAENLTGLLYYTRNRVLPVMVDNYIISPQLNPYIHSFLPQGTDEQNLASKQNQLDPQEKITQQEKREANS